MSDDDSSDSPKSPTKKPPRDEGKLAELLLVPFWTEEQAAQVLAAQKQSGQSLGRFSRQHGITASRLYKWHQRLHVQSTADDAAPPIPFRKVAVPDADKDAEADRQPAVFAAGCITVRMPSGVQIVIPQGTPEALITTVLWTLRTEPC
jgi:transposase-like protein